MTFILEEDSALKSYLTGITVADEKNATRPVNVWYGLPDIESRDVTYPYIMLDLIDVEPAAYRKHAFGFIKELMYIPDEAVPALHQYRVRPLPEPFDLISKSNRETMVLPVVPEIVLPPIIDHAATS